MVGVSYVRHHDEVDEVKAKVAGYGIQVIPKIETAEAIDNIEENNS